VRSSEWVCIAYFAYLIAAALVCGLGAARRARLASAAAALLLLVVVVARTAPPAGRDWAPLLYISFGYYLTGWLFHSPSARVEAWLLQWDRRLLGDPTTRFSAWPRWLVGYLELVYMLTFMLLPAGFLALLIAGLGREANRYWTMVAAADLGAFAPLAFIQTRPPWQLERAPTLRASGMHKAAATMVRYGTIGANTFPSGHVAVSLAIALAVMGSLPLFGSALLVLSVSIALACVVGRYHYVIDTVAGAAWGLLACGLAASINR